MKKILVAIPCVTGPDHVRECLNSVIKKENVDIMIIDNGSTPEVKEQIRYFSFIPNVLVHGNPENIYVNPAWNQAMKFFIDNPKYDYLILMNSDLVMQKQWADICRKFWDINPEYCLIPHIMDSKTVLSADILPYYKFTEVFEGTPGVFITLSRKQCEACYPLDESVKVWFGDNQIYDIVRSISSTIIPNDLIAFHHWSQTIQKVPGVYEIIEQDKIAWSQIVQPLLHKRIEEIKSKNHDS